MSNNSLNLKTIKLAITNQLARERQMGADENHMELLRNVLSDLYLQLENIVVELKND